MSEAADVADIAVKSLSLLAPAAQFVISLGVVAGAFFAAIWFMRSGERERKRIESSGNEYRGGIEIPGFLIGGPVHDAMQSVHELAEQSRRQFENDEKMIACLMDIAKAMERFNHGQEYTHRLLEASFTEEQLLGIQIRNHRR